MHEPQVARTAKGKVAKKFEFGSKVSVAMSKEENMVLAVVNYASNIYDGKTVEDTLKKVEQMTGRKVEAAIVDRGYKTRKVDKRDTQIIKPRNQNFKPAVLLQQPDQKRKTEKIFSKTSSY